MDLANSFLVLSARALNELLDGVEAHEDLHLCLVVHEDRIAFETLAAVDSEELHDFGEDVVVIL